MSSGKKMRFLRPSASQCRAEFRSGSFFRHGRAGETTVDDSILDRERYYVPSTASFHTSRKNGRTSPTDSGHLKQAIERNKKYIEDKTKELHMIESEKRNLDQECSLLGRILEGISKPDGSVNPLSISELIEYETEKSKKISEELLRVREMNRLVLDACSELKEDIKSLHLRSDLQKMRTLDRLEHPCGEIFLVRKR